MHGARRKKCATIWSGNRRARGLIHSPLPTWDYNNLDNQPNARADLLGAVYDRLRHAVRRVEDQGVGLVVENIEDIDPADRKRLVEGFASPAIRLSIDTGHAEYARGTTGAPPVDYFVTAADDLLNHGHLQDADGYADRHRAIGEGTVLWPSVFRTLAKLTVRPRLTLELRDKAGIPASMAFLTASGVGPITLKFIARLYHFLYEDLPLTVQTDLSPEFAPGVIVQLVIPPAAEHRFDATTTRSLTATVALADRAKVSARGRDDPGRDQLKAFSSLSPRPRTIAT